MLRKNARKLTVSVVLVIAALFLLVPMEPVRAIPEKTVSIQRDYSLISGQASINYDEFSRLTVRERRSMYGSLSPEVQSELWQTQFSRYLESEVLTLGQRTVLLEALQFASPSLFASNKNRKQSSYRRNIRKLKNLEIRALKAFGFENVRRIFTELGSRGGNIGLLRVSITASSLQDDETMPDCSCSRDSDYCSERSSCNASRIECKVIVDDCGFFLAYDCDGICFSNA